MEKYLQDLFEPDDLGDTAAAMREILEERFGPLPTILRVLESDPGAFLAEGLRRFRRFSGGKISPREREAAALAAAAALQCPHCLRAHVAKGREVGFSDEELAEILRMAATMGESTILSWGVRALNGGQED